MALHLFVIFFFIFVDYVIVTDSIWRCSCSYILSTSVLGCLFAFSTIHGVLCIFRILILCWLSYCRYLFSVCGLPFHLFNGVIWWKHAHGFNSTIYLSIASYEVCTFCALLKQSFCPLRRWVIKKFFSKCILYVVREVFNFKFPTWKTNWHHLFNDCLSLLLLYINCPSRHVYMLSYLSYSFGLFVHPCINKCLFVFLNTGLRYYPWGVNRVWPRKSVLHPWRLFPRFILYPNRGFLIWFQKVLLNST